MSPRRNWDSPNPSLASECALPPESGGHIWLRVRGWGSLNSDDWRKSLALCLLCDGSGTVYSWEEPDGEGFYQFWEPKRGIPHKLLFTGENFALLQR